MQTSITTKSRTFKRHDLDVVLPDMLRRVSASEFVSLGEIATAYAVDKATAHRWMQRAVRSGAVDELTWRVSLLRARLLRQERA